MATAISASTAAAPSVDSSDKHEHMEGNAAFVAFKSGAGRRVAAAYAELKQSLDVCRRSHRDAAQRVNSAKSEIDELKDAQEGLAPAQGGHSAAAAEVAKQLKAAKRRYKEAHSEMRGLKTEMEYLQKKVCAVCGCGVAWVQ